MKYSIHKSVSEIDEKQWEQLVTSSPTASFFQTKEFYCFLSKLSFLKPFVYAVSSEEKIQAIAVGYLVSEKGLKRYFSRRAVILGGVLINSQIENETLSFFLDEMAKKLKRKAIYIEIRNNSSYEHLKSVFEKSGFKYQQHYNFKIDTSNDDVLNHIGKSRIRDEKISFNKGVQVVGNPSAEEVCQWYDVLKNLYSKRVKKPLFPLEFFEKIAKEDFSKFFLVKQKGEIIGGTLCLCWENRVMYEWFACGQDRDLHQIYPSTVATLASIKYAHYEKFSTFDMLGAGMPNQKYGVRDFKNHFGGKLVQEGRFLYICNMFFYDLGTFVVKFIQKYC